MLRLVNFGYAVAGLLLVPAAVAFSLFPVNWLLGITNFQPIPLNWAPAAYLAAVPIAVTAFIVGSQRIWPLVPALVAGIVLMFLPLNTSPMGTDAGRIEQARANIEKLPAWVSEHFFALANPGKVTQFQLLVDRAQAAYDEERVRWQLAYEEWVAAHAKKAEIESRVCAGLSLGDFLFDDINQNMCQIIEQEELNRLAPRVAAADAAYSATNERLQTLEKTLVDAQAALESEQILVASNVVTADRTNAERLAMAANAPYLASASLAFLVLMYAAGFRSLFFAVLLIGTLAICLWSAWPPTGGWVLDAVFVLYPATICLLSAFVLRLAYRSFIDNNTVMKGFGLAATARAILFSVVVWLPFPAVIVGAVWAGNVIYGWAEDAAYCSGIMEERCKEAGSNVGLIDSDPEIDTLRIDINAAITAQLAAFETEALAVAGSAGENTREAMESVRAGVMSAFDRVLPPNVYDIFPGLRPPDSCDWIWPDIKCMIRQAVLNRMNAAYQGPRNRYRSQLDEKLIVVGNDIASAADTAANLASSAIQGEAEKAARHATRSVDATFLGFSAWSAAQMAFLLYVAIRAFLLVFGRVLYKGQNKVGQPFALTHGVASEGQSATAQRYPDRFDVPDQHLPLLAKRTFAADDADERTLLGPSFSMRWPLRRFANGAFALRRVMPQQAGRQVSYTALGGREFVVWTVPARSSVAFQWKNFVAMSENMTVEKDTTLRIGGLSLGTMMHAVAKSGDHEGILIQLSNGAVQLIASDPAPKARSPFRLMSWRPDAPFAIATQNSFLSIYTDGASLQPALGAHGAMDVGENTGGRGGVIGWLWSIVRP